MAGIFREELVYSRWWGAIVGGGGGWGWWGAFAAGVRHGAVMRDSDNER